MCCPALGWIMTIYGYARANAQDLAAKMQQVLGLSDAALAKMGRAGRALAEQKFDERIVLDKYLRVVASVQPTPALALKTA